MGAGTYIRRNSPIHKLNPSLKFIAYILFIVLVFLPIGFFGQTILFAVILIVYVMAKLPRKALREIFKSVAILFILLFIINWVTYKDPIAIYHYADSDNAFIGSSSWINGPIWKGSGSVSDNLVSNIWGGSISGYDAQWINAHNTVLTDVWKHNGGSINRTWNSISSDARNQVKTFVDAQHFVGADSNTAKTYYYMITNGFSFDGVQYSAFSLHGTSSVNIAANQVIFYQANWYTLSPQAIVLALYITTKIAMMIILTEILTSTTSSIELTYALEDILSPLRILKLPVNEGAMMISIALRFVPSLLDESKRILNAQASRGVDFKNGGFKEKTHSLISLIVPLFSIAFKKAEDLANAMEARAYNPRYARSRYRKYNLKLTDWLGFFMVSIVCGFLISISIFHVFFTAYGIFEASLIFA